MTQPAFPRISRFFPSVIASALLLAACGGAGAAQPAATASGSPANGQASASAAPTKLQIIYSTNTGPDNVPEWAALDAGIFQKNGLDVGLQYVAGGTKDIEALIAGDAQLSVQGGNEAMSANSNGADLVLLAGLLPIYAFKLEAAKGINSLDDIKGKKLGVSTIGGTADVALRSFLRKHNIDPDKDVSIVATGDPATTQAALLSGAVQASLSVPPNSIKAEASGLHPLADLATDKIPNAQNSLTVQRSWLNGNRAVTQKLVDSIVQGLARVKHDKTFAEGIMKKYLKLEDQNALDVTYDYFASEVWPDYPHVTADQLADGKAELSKKNDKLKNFDVSRMIDDSFVQDAEKRGVAGK